jgi:hypothetical protein
MSKRMAMARWKICAHNNIICEEIVVTFGTTALCWTHHPRDSDPRLKGEIRPATECGTCDVVDVLVKRRHLPLAIHIAHQTRQNVTISFGFTDCDERFVSRGGGDWSILAGRKTMEQPQPPAEPTPEQPAA